MAPTIKHVQIHSSVMHAYHDDGTRTTLYRTVGGLWIAKKPPVVITPPPDPDPDPTDPTDPTDPPPTGSWTHPHPGSVLTSPYGPRGFDGFHWGNDSSTGNASGPSAQGVPVVAPTTLRITISQDASPNDFHFGTAGNHVKGHTLDGAYTFSFMHLYSRAVSVGDVVNTAGRIGIEGSTGNSTAQHLHLEAFNGQFDNPGTPPYGDPVDPLPILRSKGVDI